MFFALSQILDFFLTPSNVLLLALLLSPAFFLIRIRKLAIALGLGSIMGLAFAAWSPLGTLALGALENRFPRTTLPDDVTGIIMLGGAVDTHVSFERGALVLNEAGERLVETRILAARFPEADVFLSGGGGHPSNDGSLTESELARRALIDAGVAAQRIAMEEHSRNTCENARETATALAGRTAGAWLLVTSASHMPRAVACFRSTDLDIVPYAVDFRTKRGDLTWAGTASHGLAATDLAAHEWLGLLSYRLAGFTQELFPAPQN